MGTCKPDDVAPARLGPLFATDEWNPSQVKDNFIHPCCGGSLIGKRCSFGEKTPAQSTLTDADPIWSTIASLLREQSGFRDVQ